MELSIPILLNCVLVLIVYLVDRYTPAKKIPYLVKQIIIGLLFGAPAGIISGFIVKSTQDSYVGDFNMYST